MTNAERNPLVEAPPPACSRYCRNCHNCRYYRHCRHCRHCRHHRRQSETNDEHHPPSLSQFNKKKIIGWNKIFFLMINSFIGIWRTKLNRAKSTHLVTIVCPSGFRLLSRALIRCRSPHVSRVSMCIKNIFVGARKSAEGCIPLTSAASTLLIMNTPRPLHWLIRSHGDRLNNWFSVSSTIRLDYLELLGTLRDSSSIFSP